MSQPQLPLEGSHRPIGSVDDLLMYLRRDLDRYDRSPGARGIAEVMLRQPQLRFQVRLRLTEFVANAKRSRSGRVLSAYMRWRLQSAGLRLGYTIPINRFGPGLKLPHWGTLIVNGDARIGANCTCHPNVLIGTRNGVPTIGDDVYIGNGAKIYGPITIGDHSVIAPNAVVTRDVAPHTTVAGVPARPLTQTNVAKSPADSP